jgi:hypothetical protein
VVFLHALALRVLLSTHVRFVIAEKPPSSMTWISLPPEPARDIQSTTNSSPTTVSLQAPFTGTGAVPGIALPSTPSPQPYISPLIAVTPLGLQPNPDARVLSAIGDYLVCDFLHYDELPEAERERCGLRLSHLGMAAPFANAYVDNKTTPLNIFGARGTFAITPPAQRPYDLLQSSIGCAWEGGLCRRPQPDKFGFDPDDQKRLTAAAHFELAEGLSLDLGGQAYMQNYLGGARMAYAAGVVLTYRW